MINLIADNSPSPNKTQVDVTANVVSSIVRRAQYDFGDQKLSLITDFAKARTDATKQALSGKDFINRLKRQGPSTAQATEVQTSLNKTGNDVEQRALTRPRLPRVSPVLRAATPT